MQDFTDRVLFQGSIAMLPDGRVEFVHAPNVFTHIANLNPKTRPKFLPSHAIAALTDAEMTAAAYRYWEDLNLSQIAPQLIIDTFNFYHTDPDASRIIKTLEQSFAFNPQEKKPRLIVSKHIIELFKAIQTAIIKASPAALSADLSAAFLEVQKTPAFYALVYAYVKRIQERIQSHSWTARKTREESAALYKTYYSNNNQAHEDFLTAVAENFQRTDFQGLFLLFAKPQAYVVVHATMKALGEQMDPIFASALTSSVAIGTRRGAALVNLGQIILSLEIYHPDILKLNQRTGAAVCGQVLVQCSQDKTANSQNSAAAVLMEELMDFATADPNIKSTLSKQLNMGRLNIKELTNLKKAASSVFKNGKLPIEWTALQAKCPNNMPLRYLNETSGSPSYDEINLPQLGGLINLNPYATFKPGNTVGIIYTAKPIKLNTEQRAAAMIYDACESIENIFREIQSNYSITTDLAMLTEIVGKLTKIRADFPDIADYVIAKVMGNDMVLVLNSVNSIATEIAIKKQWLPDPQFAPQSEEALATSSYSSVKACAIPCLPVTDSAIQPVQEIYLLPTSIDANSTLEPTAIVDIPSASIYETSFYGRYGAVITDPISGKTLYPWILYDEPNGIEIGRIVFSTQMEACWENPSKIQSNIIAAEGLGERLVKDFMQNVDRICESEPLKPFDNFKQSTASGAYVGFTNALRKKMGMTTAVCLESLFVFSSAMYQSTRTDPEATMAAHCYNGITQVASYACWRGGFTLLSYAAAAVSSGLANMGWEKSAKAIELTGRYGMFAVDQVRAAHTTGQFDAINRVMAFFGACLSTKITEDATDFLLNRLTP